MKYTTNVSHHFITWGIQSFNSRKWHMKFKKENNLKNTEHIKGGSDLNTEVAESNQLFGKKSWLEWTTDYTATKPPQFNTDSYSLDRCDH